jgi:hypothetical protein
MHRHVACQLVFPKSNVAFSRGAGWRGLCSAQTVTDRTVGYNAWFYERECQEVDLPPAGGHQDSWHSALPRARKCATVARYSHPKHRTLRKPTLQRLHPARLTTSVSSLETTMVLFETWQPMVISGHPRGHTVRPDPWSSRRGPGTTRRFDTHPRPFGTEKTIPFCASASLRMEVISPRLSRCRFQL